MGETLIIKNFGPIKDVTLDLRKINVFIGDQGTGKSTVAKVLYGLRKCLKSKISDNSVYPKDIESIFTELGIKTYLRDDSYFCYSIKGFKFEVSQTLGTKFDINNFDSILDEFPLQLDECYIIAERQMMAVFSDALYDFNSKRINLPFLYNELGSSYIKAKSAKSSYDFSSIIGVSFQSISGKDVIFNREMNENLQLSFASTGLQGSIPLLVVHNHINSKEYISTFRDKMNDNSLVGSVPYLVIEEPELNLFPNTQKNVLESIISKNYFSQIEFGYTVKRINDYREGRKVKSSFDGNFKECSVKHRLIITTHSPYILTSLNNLMYAYKVGQEHKAEVSKIIDEKYWVNPEDVRCYLMEDGEAKLIMDDEDGLIQADKIDGVSTTINDEFDKLLRIEMNNKKASAF